MNRVDELALRPAAELAQRIETVQTRARDRLDTAARSGRDLTLAEAAAMEADRIELAELLSASELRTRNDAQRNRLGGALDAAVEQRGAPFLPSLRVSDAHLAAHAEALAEGRPHGAVEGVVELRARVTAGGDLGSPGAWNAGQPNEPRHLIAFAGIPVSELTGKTAQVPVYTGPTGAAGVDETANHAEYDAISPANLSALRYGRWSEVSALANVVDDLRGIQQMQAWGIARDLDLLAVDAVETAAGAPAVLDELESQVRQAIWQVAASTYTDESGLVVVGTPADLALLTGTIPANGGDLGSVAVRYQGARLYPTLAATGDQVTVFAPNAFRVFQSRLQSASLIDPASGAHKFGSWLHSTGVAQQITGSAIAVATAE